MTVIVEPAVCPPSRSTLVATLPWVLLFLLTAVGPTLLPSVPFAGPPEDVLEPPPPVQTPPEPDAQSGVVVTIDRQSGQMVVELSSGRRVAMEVPPHAIGDFRPGDRVMLEADEPGR